MCMCVSERVRVCVCMRAEGSTSRLRVPRNYIPLLSTHFLSPLGCHKENNLLKKELDVKEKKIQSLESTLKRMIKLDRELNNHKKRK